MEHIPTPAQLRAEAAKKAENEAKLGHLEGFAQKLLQGFAKLDEAAAWKAPWELMQNACDLTEQCCVTVNFQDDGLAFSHNGQAFSSKTLGSLIIQKSGEKRQGQELAQQPGKVPVGQYGTGFITTHSYGRVIRLDGTLLGEAGPIELTNFVLDRSTEAQDEAGKLVELTNKLLVQEQEMYRLIEHGKLLPKLGTTTTYRYQPTSEIERRKIGVAQTSLRLYLPYVLALRDTLQRVELVDANGNRTEYVKHQEVPQEDYWQVPVLVGGHPIPISFLRSTDKEIMVLLPLAQGEVAMELPADLARLYLYFPLIGTHGWGCNFLVHAKYFTPLEPRNGLELAVDVEEAKPKAKRNQELLLEASRLVFNFLGQAAERIKQPIHLARIAFGSWPADEEEAEQHFPSKLQQLWVEQLREMPLVDTPAGRRVVTECWFLAPELLQDAGALAAIHTIAAQLWEQKIPLEELTKAWADVLSEWQDGTTQWITPELLAQKLQGQGRLGEIKPLALRQVYDYLLAHDQSKLFDHYQLLPTEAGDGDFKAIKEVLKPLNMVPQLVEVLRGIKPEVASRFVHPSFADLDLVFTSYGRNQLGKDVNDCTSKLLEEGGGTLDAKARYALQLLNSIYPSGLSASVAPSIRRRLMPVVGQYYGTPYAECIVLNVTDDELDYERTPFRTMVRVFLADFEKKYRADKEWAADDALTLLQQCLQILAPSEQLRDLLTSTPIFPNQNGRLCLPSSLEVEKEFAPAGSEARQLKQWYQRVMNAEIEEELVSPGFVDSLLSFKPRERTGETVAANLETELLKLAGFEAIINHPKADEIVDIIRAMGSNKGWENYFKNINAQKANIMLAKISDEKVKDDLFGIIGLQPEDIAQLGLLVRDGSLQEIIRKGQEALQAEADQTHDLAYKKQIGEGVEKLVRERLQTEVVGLPVTVEARQGGQDIVVLLDGNVVYRIEVKARWRPSYSATLSQPQALMASANPERYALCSIDLVSYHPQGDERGRYEVDDLTKIEDYIRFITDIGTQVEELIANARAVKGRQDRVQLAEELRVAVPNGVTDKGVSIVKFTQDLQTLLGQIATNAPIAQDS